MSIPSLWRRAGTIGAAGVVILAASTMSVAPPAAARADLALGATPTAGTQVTLISGDRALVGKDPAGRETATVLPGPHADPGGYVTRAFRGDVYVFPSAAVPLINAGRLDEELFNVTGLARQGYDDRASDSLPLLATYGGSVARTRQAPQPPDGADVVSTLTAADAVALSVDKQDTARLWQDLTDTDGPRIAKLWLDERVSADLADSTAQINAPKAWADGFDGTGTTVAVLDSGYDATHPDLAGQVIDEKNFTSEAGGAVDRHGHGTHVASTVAGTGAASGGAEKGVAPGAKLLIGKVLDRAGNGQESWIIAGMQWAVDKGADVVNMSLGGSIGTDCTDPIGVAAQRLTAQADTLFVLAAGNSGPGAHTLGSPACADAALTVAAVDAAGATAPFSSRGPVTGSHRVKPEISAPGVGIVAARNGGGTSDPYTSMSGTSMAAPHVAGVAALLTQRHPAMSAQQRKAVLVSSVAPGASGGVYAQGAGVVDAFRAVTADVYGPGTVDAGSFNWPHLHQQPATTKVTLTNDGAAPVTFALSIEGATGEDGTPLPQRTLTTGLDTVTVPAHGTADVPVILDPAVRQTASAYGTIGGRLVARAGDGTTVTTAIGAWLEPHTVTVTLHLIDRRGQAPATPSFVDVVDVDRLTGQRFTTFDEDPVLRLREGRYSIAALIASHDDGTTGEAGLVKSITFMGDPDLVVNHDDTDRTITYDARTAIRQKVDGERPLEAQNITMQYGRWWDGAYLSASYTGGKSVDDVYVGRTTPVHSGGFELDTFYRMYAPELDLRTSGGVILTPEYLGAPFTQPSAAVKFDGNGSAPLTFAGAGTAAELAAAGVAGKVVLVHDAADPTAVLSAAATAGAKAVLFGRDAAGRWNSVAAGNTIPGLTISGAESTALREALSAGPVTLEWKAVAASPYAYNLAFVDDGMTRPDVVRHVRDRDLGRVDETVYSMRTDRAVFEVLQAYRPSFPTVASMASVPQRAPFTRTAYFTADQQWRQLIGGAGVFDEYMVDLPRTYAAGSARRAEWYRGPVRSVGTRRADLSPEHIGERQEDLIGIAMLPFGDSDPNHYSAGGGFGDAGNVQVYRDGVQIGSSPFPSGAWSVPDEAADYELRVTTMRFNPGPPYHPNWNLFHRTDTSFRFRSQRPADDGLHALPLLVPSYDIAVDERNLTPATADFKVGFGAAGQRDYDAGRIVSARMWASFDSGTTWSQVPVAQSGAGFTATVDQSGQAGRDASLRVELTDEHGSTVEQTLIKAYGVR
ncbi:MULTISPECIES: S8 family serine peptidase [Micromonospora]|uniref:Peptidase n=1 Tax=Micromonospora solifontis TaxID=2487138 RepID=A0ABX9WL19_9ACTN|nr:MULTISPECIES: S8 family serine peptidase [Micromonospora]NES14896.1 S8 family serine peptidase [Micromonospora sp. PPF5-17B]NES35181.1 S8 family serine peptidase [Micromonospora solifontis]NES55176.1 S8 family serine peptidase [Micromonospora sp. PPF5-6]RNM01161.1 peptidase [Micromonospora solifontis]